MIPLQCEDLYNWTCSLGGIDDGVVICILRVTALWSRKRSIVVFLIITTIVSGDLLLLTHVHHTVSQSTDAVMLATLIRLMHLYHCKHNANCSVKSRLIPVFFRPFESNVRMLVLHARSLASSDVFIPTGWSLCLDVRAVLQNRALILHPSSQRGQP